MFVSCADVELRRVGDVEHVPAEAQPVIGDAEPERLAQAQVDGEVAVAAEHVAHARLRPAAARRKKVSASVGVGERARPVRRPRSRRSSVSGSRFGSTSIALPCRFQLVAQHERQLATLNGKPLVQRISPATDQSPINCVDGVADAAAEALALAERQLREPVGVDLVAHVEVRRAVVQLRLERVDQEPRAAAVAEVAEARCRARPASPCLRTSPACS